MGTGIIFTIMGLALYSVMGFLYKMIVYKNCNIKNTLLITFSCSTFLSIIMCFLLGKHFNLIAMVIGIIAGISLYAAIYFYIKSLTLGKRVTSWVIFKMSLVIAVAISVFLWGEKPTSNQITGFFLMLLAIIFLGIDMKIKGDWKNVG